VLYNVLLRLNVVVSRVRNWLGLPHWSLSQYLKNKTKEAVNYVNNFEELITDYCRKQHAQGVICGHVHRAEIKTVGDIVYMNDGDWVESCTALVETLQGEWKIIRWLEQKSSL
jgi:UDP-2,3-diacylglucosamine pyrophosphatase LpxH